MDAPVDLSKSPIPEVLAALATDPHKGLDAKEAAVRLGRYGPNALEEKKTSAWVLFFRFFWGPIPWMIEAAALMAAVVRDWGDFTIILALLLFNAALGFLEEHQASNALQALKNALALKAKVLRDGAWSEIDAKDIVPGDIVRVRLGDVVPADARIVSGEYLSVDQAALTGESLPVSKKPGDSLYSGSIAKQGEVQAVVTETGSHTFFGRTASLVQSAGATSHFQAAVMRIGDFLIAAAGVLAVILIAVQLSRGADVLRLAEFVLILLVASVPVAMPAVLSVTMALGAKLLAREKAIVSRLDSIEEMAGMEILCSDKTGTLTQNKLTLGDVSPWRGADRTEILLVASLASRAEDRDPIDLAVLAGLHDDGALKAYTQQAYQPFDPVTKRTEATVKGPDGVVFHAAKGAPQVMTALAKLEGADLEAANRAVDSYAAKGFRTLGVARTDASGAWRFLGFIPLYDPPRADSKETIARAEGYGVRVKMVTGDDVAIAQQIAGDLGLGTGIQPATDLFSGGVGKGDIPADIAERIEAADGFARVFPEHKYAIVKALQQRGHIVGMTGDGVNDAPALKQADIGVAVSGATDAARAAAALILTAPGLSTIIRGIEEARRIFERMMSYTLYRIAMTLDIMVFIVLATIVYGFFPLTPVMIIMLALLDDIPIMTIAFDRAQVPGRPVRWQMDRVLVVSSVLGALAVVQSFGLLVVGQNMLRLDAPHLQTILFLQLVVGGHLMLFVTRTKGPFWMPPFPGIALFCAIVATQIVAALLCVYGVLVPALPWELIGLVWAYNIAWMFIQDLAKLAIYRELGLRADRATTFLSRLHQRLGAAQRREAQRPAGPSPDPHAGPAASFVATALGLGALAALLWTGHLASGEGAPPALASAARSAGEAHPETSASVHAPAPQPPASTAAAERPDEPAAPAATTAAASARAAKASVRLGGFPTEARAAARWRQLQKRTPAPIASSRVAIRKAARDGKDAWFVEISEFASQSEAAAFCKDIGARRADCEAATGE
ncbi:MAG: plasma-membrane proton-efflux P-type ATPase [Methylocystis sp.]|uniref:plasma-membrane proton-efflux P-type ATPase n=1 Tax=Methylocystis sp. TaxID=1911079 RepID=UPI003DA5E7D8